LRVTGAGVLTASMFFGKVVETSDIGGDGGSCASDTVSAAERALLSGGVRISGELAVELGEWSNVGDSGMVISVDIVER
jgi:hypothetical protein